MAETTATMTTAAAETPAATIAQVANEVTSPGATDRVAGTTASTHELDAQFEASRQEAKEAAKADENTKPETEESD